MNINEISICLQKLMNEDIVLKNYNIININSKMEKVEDIK